MPLKFIIKNTSEMHRPEILKLNENMVHFLSPLNEKALIQLEEIAEMCKVVEFDGKIVAFLMAIKNGKTYESLNYQWFTENLKTFLYVDRIVLSANVRKMGLGKLLYGEVFRYAKESGIPKVTAEIDVLPENMDSLKFHAALGFREVGKQYVADGKKQVSLQVADVEETLGMMIKREIL